MKNKRLFLTILLSGFISSAAQMACAEAPVAAAAGTSQVPWGMTSGDIGSPATSGRGGYQGDGETWTVAGAGTGVDGTADQFQFLRYNTAGDGDIIAQLVRRQGAGNSSKAGVMARSGSDAGAVNAAVFHSADNTITFQYRDSANGAIGRSSVPNIAGPVYLKLSRAGTSWSGAYSTDGTRYTPVGSAVSIPGLGAGVYDAGLAVTSGKADSKAEAAFRNFSAPLNLISKGVVKYQIHLADPSNEVLKAAADELASYLARIGGGEPPAITADWPAKTASGPWIILGDTNKLTQALAPKIDYSGLSRQGFVIKTVGPNIIIANTTPGGTQYGAIWFLDRILGVHWLAPKVTHVPSRPDLSIPSVNERQTPRFEFRQVLDIVGQDSDMAWHNLMNGRAYGAASGATPPGSANWNKSWAWDYYNGSFSGKVPPPAPQLAFNEPGVSGGMQVTMMSEFSRQKMAETIIKDMKKQNQRDQSIIDNNYYTVSQNDHGWSPDKASVAFAKEHGWKLSAPLVDMMSDVLKRVRATKDPKYDFSKAKLAFQAYQWGFSPPTGMKLPEGLMVIPYDIHLDQSSDFGTDLETGGYNQQLARDLIKWNEIITDKIQYFNHTTNFQNFCIPTPNIYPIAKNIRWLSGLDKVQGYIAEGDHWNWTGNVTDFVELKVWLTARMLWNPNVSDAQIGEMIATWCDGYHGPAGPFIKQYIDLTQHYSDLTKSPSWEKDGIENPMYTVDYVKAADALFVKATAAVAGDPALLGRVNRTRVSLDNLILQRRAEYAYKDPKFDVDFPNRLARLKATVEANKVRMSGQGMPVADIFMIAELNRTYPAAVPKVASDMAPGAWGQVQEFDLIRYQMGKNIVEDPLASDGVAMKLASSKNGVKTAFKVQNLPNDGEAYDVWVALRADIAPGTDGAAKVLRISEEFAPGNKQVELTASRFADGQYQYIKIQNGPHKYQNNDLACISFKVMAINEQIKAVYLDRIVYTRAAPVPEKKK